MDLISKEKDEEAKEHEENDHPFLMLGYGIYSYFTFLEQLIALLVIMTVLSIPIIGIYGSGSFIGGLDPLVTTMGNLGATNIECVNEPMPV